MDNENGIENPAETEAENEETGLAEGLELAFYSDRFVAFTVDVALAVAGFFLSYKLLFWSESVWNATHGYAMANLWVVLFLAYQGVFNADGRQTVGKKLMGIRVVDFDGQPLELQRALLRSAGHLLSGVLGLGYVWPLFNSKVQALHDLVGASVVVLDEPKGTSQRAWVLSGAWASFVLLAGYWVWVFCLATPYYRIMSVAHAKKGLHYVADLQESYKTVHGRYTDNIIALAEHSGNRKTFYKTLNNLYNPEFGFEIKLKGRKGYMLLARARDRQSTQVHLEVN